MVSIESWKVFFLESFPGHLQFYMSWGWEQTNQFPSIIGQERVTSPRQEPFIWCTRTKFNTALQDSWHWFLLLWHGPDLLLTDWALQSCCTQTSQGIVLAFELLRNLCKNLTWLWSLVPLCLSLIPFGTFWSFLSLISDWQWKSNM